MEKIKEKLEKIIREVFRISTEAAVTLAPEEFKADFSSNVAMKITGEVNRKLAGGELGEIFKEERVSPREVAEVLRDEFLKIRGDKLSEEAENGAGAEARVETEFEVEVAGAGFLNFTPRDEFYFNFIESLGEELADFEKKISPDEYKGKTVVCEFSDPNPFKVLHVGHLYTSIVGDSISRLIETAGGKVIRANFGGDVGLHVAKTIYAIRGSLATDFTIEDVARAYVEGTRAYEEDEEAKKKIVQLNKIIYKIAEKGEGNLEGLNEEERGIAEIYWKGRELSYKYFKDFYKEIGVKFDKFYPESTVAKTGLNKILEQKEKGVYSESDGAIVFRGEDFGLHTRVFVNKEGLPTYEAKDVGLLLTKWADWKFDESVVITGNDIIEYMKVVLKSVEQYEPELVRRTTHITHGNVRLPGNEKMSSRKGNFVKAIEVLESVEKALKGGLNQSSLDVLASSSSESQHSDLLAQCDSGNTGRRSCSQVNVNNSDSGKLRIVSSKTDLNFRAILLGAVKYYFLKYRIGGNIVFDAEESVALNGNSGPYLLYSVVRAKKIFSKLSVSASSASADALLAQRMSNTSRFATPASLNKLETESFGMNDFERRLNKKFVQYKDVLGNAIREKAPHLIANYLFELAQEFSRFYENCPVRGSETEIERRKFVQVFIKIMEHGLGILGIEVPEEM